MTGPDRRSTSSAVRWPVVILASVLATLVLLALAFVPTCALSPDGGGRRFRRPRLSSPGPAAGPGGNGVRPSPPPSSRAAADVDSIEERRRSTTTRSSKRRVFLAKGALTLATSAAVVASRQFPATTSTDTSTSLTSSSAIRPPGKKSTASEVVAYLRNTDHLAPYATGGTAVVTGGNSGIGLESVAALASSGMNVILCTRRTDAGLAARGSLPESIRERVTVLKMDLADMSSVQSAAAEIAKSCGEKGLDVLVNNAGVADKAGPAQYTSQGLELQWGTNHVGHHLLTRLLLPSVNKGGRVVTVSSKAHYFASDTTQWGTGADGGYYSSPYCQSKLCNVLFATALQERLNREGRDDVKSVSLHPGVIATPLFNGSTPIWKFIELTADKTPAQGAATSTLCALADEVEGGAFYDDCRIADMSELAKDVGGRRREELWVKTESVIRENGIELPVRLA